MGKPFDLDEFMEENWELFEDLANSLMCPRCRKVARAPFFNLGVEWDWAEGCQKCHGEMMKIKSEMEDEKK